MLGAGLGSQDRATTDQFLTGLQVEGAIEGSFVRPEPTPHLPRTANSLTSGLRAVGRSGDHNSA
jgi:hypothetical protein